MPSPQPAPRCPHRRPFRWSPVSWRCQQACAHRHWPGQGRMSHGPPRRGRRPCSMPCVTFGPTDQVQPSTISVPGAGPEPALLTRRMGRVAFQSLNSPQTATSEPSTCRGSENPTLPHLFLSEHANLLPGEIPSLGTRSLTPCRLVGFCRRHVSCRRAASLPDAARSDFHHGLLAPAHGISDHRPSAFTARFAFPGRPAVESGQKGPVQLHRAPAHGCPAELLDHPPAAGLAQLLGQDRVPDDPVERGRQVAGVGDRIGRLGI